jgi:TP901 family phage tail tape measure protein
VSAQFEIRVISGNSASTVQELKGEIIETAQATGGLNDKIDKIGQSAFNFNNISQAVQSVFSELNRAVQPGIDFNSSLTDLSAITGVAGAALDDIGSRARATAKEFGLDGAAGAVEANKLLLSQLGPELAKTPEQLDAMTRNAALLSKQLGGDMTAATEVLTTAMNQYGVSLKDPIEATRIQSEMMNIMSAAAQAGSAELPQIKAALEQSGMMAKTANVSFSELNAAIQVLDASGKKGAEGGVALRNIMARLSEGSFMPKATIEMLQAAGINVNALADKSLSLSQRLELLKPIMNDTAAMTQLFGTESVSAGIALINSTNTIDGLNNSIVGTSAATDIANVTMGSFSERMARVNAWFKDLSIDIFAATEGFLPFVQIGGSALQMMTNLGGAVHAFSILGKTQLVTSIAASLTSMGTWIASTITATAAQWGLNVALTANPIGIVVVAIGAAVAAIALLINYWDEIKAAIFRFAQWVWDHHPFKWLIDVTDRIFPGFKATMGQLWDWIKEKFEMLFGWIGDVWDSVKSFFGGGDDPEVKAAIETKVTTTGEPIPGINTAGVANTDSPLAGFTPGAKNKRSLGKGSEEAASNVSSGGRPSNVTLTIHKLIEQFTLHTTTLEAGGRQAAEQIVEMLLEQINGINRSLETR